MTVVLTRPEDESAEIAALLEAEGLPALIWPLTRIVDCDDPRVPKEADGIVVTSAHGLRALARASDRRDLPVLTVGRQSAALAREAGYADVRSAEGDSDALAALAVRSGLQALYHPHGAHLAGRLAERLREVGVRLAQQVVYRAVATVGPPPPAVAELLENGAPAVLTAWSPRGAALLSDVAAPLLRRPGRLRAAAISGAAAGPLTTLGLAAVHIAERPDRDGMLGAIRTAHAALR